MASQTTPEMQRPKKRMQPIVAMKALKELVANPEDTAKVFEIIRAMAGDANERCYDKFKQTDSGRRIMSQDESLLSTLQDREKLEAMAPNSFGRAYLRFLDAESLSPDGLVEASESADQEAFVDQGLENFSLRMRDQHDLWHVLSGYGRDYCGEACLLAFTYAQTKNRGLGLICLIGSLRQSRDVGNGIFKSVWQAYRTGKKANWLPAVEWEKVLPLPIEQVRNQLNMRMPERYLELPDVLPLVDQVA